MIDLADRIALVTGASRGIGKAIASRLAERGARVVAAARGENAKAVADEIAAAGGRCEHIALDVTEPGAGAAAIAGVVQRHGRIDILVNNAGIARDQLMLRMKHDDWDAVLGTNLTAAFVLTQAALKPMLKQRAGRIVNISSVVGQAGNAGQANYAASKAGLIAMSKSMAAEVAQRNITINCVAPGFIKTPMTDALNDQQKTMLLQRIPAGRLGTPGDCANAVVFLASEEANYVTGQTIHVNGGMAMIYCLQGGRRIGTQIRFCKGLAPLLIHRAYAICRFSRALGGARPLGTGVLPTARFPTPRPSAPAHRSHQDWSD